MIRIGSNQRLVLLALAEHTDSPPTPREVAEYIAHKMRSSHRPTADAENMANTLRSLERRGLAERLGASSTGARCWAITDAGRLLIDESPW